MSSTTLLFLVGLPLGAMMLGFIAITFAAGHAARSSARSSARSQAAKAVPYRQVSPQAFAEARALIDRGKQIEAIKLIRQDSGMGLKEAKEYADAVKAGLVAPPPPPAAAGGLLSDRVRAFRDAGDRASAIALVQAETGMGGEEAARFVDALD